MFQTFVKSLPVTPASVCSSDRFVSPAAGNAVNAAEVDGVVVLVGDGAEGRVQGLGAGARKRVPSAVFINMPPAHT